MKFLLLLQCDFNALCHEMWAGLDDIMWEAVWLHLL